MKTCSMTTTQKTQMFNANNNSYSLSRDQAKLVSTLIHKELIEYKHVKQIEDGVFFRLLESTLTQMDNPQEFKRTSEGS